MRGHAERTAELAERIAAELGWSAGRRPSLRRAARLHDIGKSGVPVAILGKEGALGDDEYALVRTHAARGAALLAGVLSAEEASWVRHHHERWDGRGYPDALSGEAIPEGARILTVADTWDAMVSDRPYRPGLTARQALAECRRCAGSQLWPPAVTALAALMERTTPLPAA